MIRVPGSASEGRRCCPFLPLSVHDRQGAFFIRVCSTGYVHVAERLDRSYAGGRMHGSLPRFLVRGAAEIDAHIHRHMNGLMQIERAFVELVLTAASSRIGKKNAIRQSQTASAVIQWPTMHKR